MTTGSFPSDPSSRRAILVLRQHDIEKCEYEPGAALGLLDDEAFVLQFPVGVQEDCNGALQNILDARLVQPGAMLVQSPYDPDTYEDAEFAPQLFACAKLLYFSTLCGHLGAREVSVEQIDLRTRTGKPTLDIKGQRLQASAQLTVESQELEKFRARMNLRDEFAGGPANLEAAEQLLDKTGLWSDPNMRTLFELRRDGINQLVSRKLVLSLSSEAEKNLKVVGRLKVPAFVEMSGRYDRVVHEQYDYTLTVLVKF